MSEKPAYNYEIYIGAPAGKVWNGIVDGEMTKHYVCGTRLESKLKKALRLPTWATAASGSSMGRYLRSSRTSGSS